MRQFSDEELTAFLDNEADPALAREIETTLAADPKLSQRLADLHVDKDALSGAFDALLAAAPAAPDQMTAAKSQPFISVDFFKLAAAILLAVGVGWALGHRKPILNEWQDYAAAYHKLYVVETLKPTGFSPNMLEEQLLQVGSAIGLALPAEQLQSFGGLKLKRSQVLGFEGVAIAHIAFQAENGEPVALCVSKGQGSEAVHVATTQGMQSARWSKDGHAYLLIGGTNADLIAHAAAHFQNL